MRQSFAANLGGPPPVPVDDLVEGMVLGEDVHDTQGRLLMPSGTELTTRHLRAFQMYGMTSIRIRSADAATVPAPISEAELADAAVRVLPRFRHNDLAHPVVAALLTWCTRVEAREAQLRGASHV